MFQNSFSEKGKSYILVHGAWHGAWCWNKVVPLLESRGHSAVAVNLPGRDTHGDSAAHVSLNDYVDAVVEAAIREDGPVLLVGHSMSGIVIAQASEKLGRDKVSALIFLDAFMPRDGESLFQLVDETVKHVMATSGRMALVENIIISEDQKVNWVNPDMAANVFCHDCPEEDKQFVLSRLSKEPVAPLATPLQLSNDVYGVIPKYYILCTESRDLDKTFLSTHVSCKKVFRLASGHSPFFSMPEQLVDILDEVTVDVTALVR
jgi:pimeloyl-ACP methyl ester carboxylesterase